MKRILLALLCCAIVSSTYARNGYNIKVKFTDKADSMLILAHYFGKPLPTIYKQDSAKMDKDGYAVFNSKDSILGGIYIVMLENKSAYFEFLLNNGDQLEITATASSLPASLKFKGSKENDYFMNYMGYLRDFSEKQESFNSELTRAKSEKDTSIVRTKMQDAFQELTQFRRGLAKSAKGSLMSNILNAMDEPEVPKGKHYLPSGAVDSTFDYLYYKNHYWDGFNFSDNRLIHTPIYDGKLDKYMNSLVYPIVDSVIKEGDILLRNTRGSKELFRYTLWWLTRNAEQSKIMGMDEVFVHLVQNYFMQGDAYWLDEEGKKKYVDRAIDIMPTLLNKQASELRMPDVNGKMQSLYDVKSKYTLLVFFSPDCGHCITEVPKIDSVYRAVLKDKGVKIFSIATEDQAKWKTFIEKNKLENWINVADWERRSDYRNNYDIKGTPVLYLLDENKRIVGKRFDHSNIVDVIERAEFMKKEADKRSANKVISPSASPSGLK